MNRAPHLAIWLLVLSLTGLAAACGGDDEPSQPDAADTADTDAAAQVDAGPPPWEGFDVPPPAKLVIDCGTCHDLVALAKPATAVTAGPATWAAAHARGMVRHDPIFPSPLLQFRLPWPKRGHHDAAAMKDCAICHPVRLEDGLGHGLLAYPDPTTPFKGGADCASNCHGWLPDAIKQAPLWPASPQLTYAGSSRAAAMLAAVKTGHTTLFEKGIRLASAKAFSMPSYNPGCGGCHNFAAEDHGTVSGCLDCHIMGAGDPDAHSLHVSRITTQQAAFDPEGKKSGKKACDYCHTPESGPALRSSAACYGCHLSGHQPLDADGKAHFWRQP